MSVVQLSLQGGRSVEVEIVGPTSGRPVLYFHSPSGSGEELGGAERIAAQMDLRLITLRRPSVICDEPSQFVDAVAADVAALVEALGLERPVILGWSGGSPYALAAAASLGPVVDSILLVSPTPGSLTGPDAVEGQSDRLREVANTTAESPWVRGPASLRDYQAIAAPWTIDVESIVKQVTVWAPTDDEIVPVRLAKSLSNRLINSTTIEVPGAHDWLLENWSTVLERVSS